MFCNPKDTGRSPAIYAGSGVSQFRAKALHSFAPQAALQNGFAAATPPNAKLKNRENFKVKKHKFFLPRNFHAK